MCVHYDIKFALCCNKIEGKYTSMNQDSIVIMQQGPTQYAFINVCN